MQNIKNRYKYLKRSDSNINSDIKFGRDYSFSKQNYYCFFFGQNGILKLVYNYK